MGIRINGTTEPAKQPSEISWDPQKGFSRVDSWESAGDNLWGLATNLAALGIAYNLTSAPFKSVIRAQSSGPAPGQPEQTTDTWQIAANEIQKDLLELPLSAPISGADITKIRAALQTNVDPSPALTGNAAATYDLMKRGTTHYALGQYVLRHTTNVSNRYAVNVADLNIERIYTTAQLIAECANATSWAYPIPARLIYKLQTIVAPTARSGFLWGWRKLPSTESSTAGNRVEISTDYWLEQWSTYIYGVAA